MGKKVDKPQRLVDQVLLTPEKVSEKLTWSVMALATRRARRQGPPWIKIGSRVRYPENALNEWLEQGQQEVA